MNPTILILGAVLVASGAFAQTDLSKAVPPTPAKPTVSGTLTTITPVAPQKTTSQPGNTMPTGNAQADDVQSRDAETGHGGNTNPGRQHNRHQCLDAATDRIALGRPEASQSVEVTCAGPTGLIKSALHGPAILLPVLGRS